MILKQVFFQLVGRVLVASEAPSEEHRGQSLSDLTRGTASAAEALDNNLGLLKPEPWLKATINVKHVRGGIIIKYGHRVDGRDVGRASALQD